MMNRRAARRGRGAGTRETRHGWSKALLLPPDLYPGVGGKMFRAELVQSAFLAAGGVGEAPAGVIDAIEMLHAGSLVVDDFEDGSEERRGQPALHNVVGPAKAVNAGSWMYFRAMELAARAHRDPTRRVELLERFVEVGRICHEGQAIDLTARADRVAPREARATAAAISRWKTGSLVSLAAWCGVHAAGGDASLRRLTAAFGNSLGVCLQMRNDLEEVENFAAGARRSDDLRNARVTWPWAWAAAVLPAADYRKLQTMLHGAGADTTRLRDVAKRLVEVTADVGRRSINGRIGRLACRLGNLNGDLRTFDRLRQVADRLQMRDVPSAAGVAR